MNLADQKYENFKNFLLNNEHVAGSYKQAIQLCPRQLFSLVLRQHLQERSMAEVIKLACEKAEIDLTVIDPKDFDKFSRYILYFSEER